MANRKSLLRVFLVCTAVAYVIPGYVIRCDSLKSVWNKHLHILDHDTAKISRDLGRTSAIIKACVCERTYVVDRDVKPVLLIQEDFNKSFEPSHVLFKYRFIFISTKQKSYFNFSSRTEKMKTKRNKDSVAGQNEDVNVSDWIHGNKITNGTSTNTGDEITNHSNSFLEYDGTPTNLYGRYNKFDRDTLELKPGKKVSIALVYAVIHLVLMIFTHFKKFLNQSDVKFVKGNTPYNAYNWKCLKYYLESVCPSIVQHHSRKNDNSVARESRHWDLQKKVLEVTTMSTLTPPQQNIVVAPVTELNEYFESMNQSDTSNIDVSLNIEILRLETFHNFPRSVAVSTIRLAENGFFYTGNSDEVECFHCGVRYSGWGQGDTPSNIHKEISPNCDFVRGRKTINIPLLQSSIPNLNQEKGETHRRFTNVNIREPDQSGEKWTRGSQFRFRASSKESFKESFESHTHNSTENECHSNGNEINSHINTWDYESQIKMEEIAILEMEANGRETINCENDQHSNVDKRPYMDNNNTEHNGWRKRHSGKLQLTPLAYVRKSTMYPAYAIPTIRLSSYKGWLSTSGLMPKSLADAGFIYAGYGDLVRCFCCGGALRNWLPGDDPWIEHARWFPECVYLRQSKGDNFIQLVHEDVRLPQVIDKMDYRRNTGVTDLSPESVTRKHSQDPVSPLGKDPFIQRVKEMGFKMDVISFAVTSLQRQEKPIDVYTIANEILRSEATPLRDGFDEVDESRKKKSVVQKNIGQTQDKEMPLRVNGICKICLEEEACVMFLPCHHVTCCEACSSVFLRCPVCRQTITGKIKISF